MLRRTSRHLAQVATSWRSLLRVDAAGVVHVHELARLRADPMFAPLAPATVERLAANLRPVEIAAGSWIVMPLDPPLLPPPQSTTSSPVRI